VRVTVKDAVAGKYVHAVHVKVIGTHNPQFNAGETDLRGIFTADGICGTTTVIARSDKNRYAFYRGKTFLGQRPEDAKKPESAKSEAPDAPAQAPTDGKGQLLENLRLQNSIFNNDQRENCRQFQQKDNKGVKAKAAF
jgi:alpha-2-macroglobulin